jgi:hypothetical protein
MKSQIRHLITISFDIVLNSSSCHVTCPDNHKLHSNDPDSQQRRIGSTNSCAESLCTPSSRIGVAIFSTSHGGMRRWVDCLSECTVFKISFRHFFPLSFLSSCFVSLFLSSSHPSFIAWFIHSIFMDQFANQLMSALNDSFTH